MKRYLGQAGAVLGVALLMFVAPSSALQAGGADGVSGCWRTKSDEDGKIKSKVCLWIGKDGKMYGAIKELYNPDEPNPTCTKCSDWRKNKPITGMTIVTGLKNTGDAWEGGYILDPKNGKTYRCKMWKEGGVLKVRGYIAFVYRTQTWYP